jgi:hypothetical protein
MSLINSNCSLVDIYLYIIYLTTSLEAYSPSSRVYEPTLNSFEMNTSHYACYCVSGSSCSNSPEMHTSHYATVTAEEMHLFMIGATLL